MGAPLRSPAAPRLLRRRVSHRDRGVTAYPSNAGWRCIEATFCPRAVWPFNALKGMGCRFGLDVVKAPQPGMPAGSERGGAIRRLSDESFGCLVGRQRGCVEPPSGVAELAAHVSFQLLVSIEVK